MRVGSGRRHAGRRRRRSHRRRRHARRPRRRARSAPPDRRTRARRGRMLRAGGEARAGAARAAGRARRARRRPGARRHRPIWPPAPVRGDRDCERERGARASGRRRAVLPGRRSRNACGRAPRCRRRGASRAPRDVGLVPGRLGPRRSRLHPSEVGVPSYEGRSWGEPRPSARRLWTSSGRSAEPMTLNCDLVAEDEMREAA